MPKKIKSKIRIEQPVPMRKQVYLYLRGKILDQSIRPSSRLVEARIAKDIGISRTPVREALHLLEKDGFVEAIPRVGYRVKKLDWEELNEIFEIRRVNEKLACFWALDRIEEKILKKLEKNIEKTELAIEKGAPEEFLAFDEEFHEILVSSAGSKNLFELCQQLRRLMLRYRAASIKTASAVKTALKEHRMILECLKNKDKNCLEQALNDHLNHSKDNIRSAVLTDIPINR
ncbi:MAG: GntR family transcriptional regulator [Deltaproteobacteria bacterium]|nr:GntR family transcriptional regulator [Deltaproteobacteria bacterium]